MVKSAFLCQLPLIILPMKCMPELSGQYCFLLLRLLFVLLIFVQNAFHVSYNLFRMASTVTPQIQPGKCKLQLSETYPDLF